MTKTISAFIVAAALVTAAPAYANEGAMHHAKTEAVAFGKPGDAKNVDRTITITATEIEFDVKDVTVKAGETVRFVLVNKGEQPHELSLGSTDEMAEHRQMMVDMAGMDMSEMHHGGGNSVSTEPGETKELIWQFGKAGSYEFSCNYPGHSEIGMTGPLVVK
ncbi:MAG: cupredoxin family protein [Parvibaculum sp.]|nr:cupredoxin family protein [Parvibaculum sp.]